MLVGLLFLRHVFYAMHSHLAMLGIVLHLYISTAYILWPTIFAKTEHIMLWDICYHIPQCFRFDLIFPICPMWQMYYFIYFRHYSRLCSKQYANTPYSTCTSNTNNIHILSKQNNSYSRFPLTVLLIIGWDEYSKTFLVLSSLTC